MVSSAGNLPLHAPLPQSPTGSVASTGRQDTGGPSHVGASNVGASTSAGVQTGTAPGVADAHPSGLSPAALDAIREIFADPARRPATEHQSTLVASAAIAARTLATAATAGISWGHTAAALDPVLNKKFADDPDALRVMKTAAVTSATIAAEQLVMQNAAVPAFHALLNAKITPVSADKLYPDLPADRPGITENDKQIWKEAKEEFVDHQQSQVKNRLASTALDLSFGASSLILRSSQNQAMNPNWAAATSWTGGALAGLTMSSTMLYASHQHPTEGKVRMFVAESFRPAAPAANQGAANAAPAAGGNRIIAAAGNAAAYVGKAAAHVGSSVAVGAKSLRDDVALKPKPMQAAPAEGTETGWNKTKRLVTNSYNATTNVAGHFGGLLWRNFTARSLLGATTNARPYQNPTPGVSDSARQGKNGGIAAGQIMGALTGGDYAAGGERLKGNRSADALRVTKEAQKIGKDFVHTAGLASRAQKNYETSTGNVAARVASTAAHAVADGVASVREHLTIPARLTGALLADALDTVDAGARWAGSKLAEGGDRLRRPAAGGEEAVAEANEPPAHANPLFEAAGQEADAAERGELPADLRNRSSSEASAAAALPERPAQSGS